MKKITEQKTLRYVNFKDAYEKGVLSADPTKILIRKKELRNILFTMALSPSRENRPRRAKNAQEKECPLCYDALTTGFISSVNSSFSLTFNRYPGSKKELLLVRNNHDQNQLDANELAAAIRLTKKEKFSILYSNAVKSIPCHEHTVCAYLSLPIAKAKSVKITEHISITYDYPALSLIIKGTPAQQAKTTVILLDIFLLLNISYNLIILSEGVFIHPIKTIDPFNVKQVGPREAAGYIGTSDKQLFKLLTTTNLGYAMLKKASYTKREIQKFLERMPQDRPSPAERARFELAKSLRS